MARIRHIALVTDDPAKTAEFYKEHFGLTELYRRPGDTARRSRPDLSSYVGRTLRRLARCGRTCIASGIHEARPGVGCFHRRSHGGNNSSGSLTHTNGIPC